MLSLLPLSFLAGRLSLSSPSVIMIVIILHLQLPPTQDDKSDRKALLINKEICPTFGRIFRRRGLLGRHLRSHDPEQRNYSCDYDDCNQKGA
jgi:hypothetical protein